MYHYGKVSKKLHNQIRAFIREQAAEVYEYAKTQYPNLEDKLKVVVNTKTDDYKSVGGITSKSQLPFIQINYQYQLRFQHNEWKFPKNDKYIGDFVSKSFKKRISALICHEVAHAIQMQIVYDFIDNRRHVNIPKGHYYPNPDGPNWEKWENYGSPRYEPDIKFGHGVLWQSIYKKLRKKFVNGKVYSDKGLELNSNVQRKNYHPQENSED